MLLHLPVGLSFITVCALIEATPGPNMAYLAIVSLTRGKYAGLFAVLGVALGLLCIGVAASFGVATLVSASPYVYHALRLSGVLYLLWLAGSAWKGETDKQAMAEVCYSDGLWCFFRQGVITNILNPKAWLFYVTILPDFVTATEKALAQTLVLTVLYVAVATAIHCSIVLLAASLRPFLETENHMRLVRRVMALALAGVAVWLAWETA